MIEDPYKILGVSQSATQEEIRKAYRRKAKEYHPDLHPNDPAANRKMNEVNEAYDMLMNPQKYEAKRAQQTRSRQNQSGSGQQSSSNSYQGPGGWASDFDNFSFEDLFGFGFTEPPGQNGRMPQTESSDSPEIRRVILAINNGRNREALDILFHIPSYGRNARWYYLNGLANHNLGNTVQAADHMQKAVQMDPNNRVYHQLLQQFRQSGRTYEQNARSFNMREIEMNKMCCGLMAAPVCCGPVGCMPCYI